MNKIKHLYQKIVSYLTKRKAKKIDITPYEKKYNFFLANKCFFKNQAEADLLLKELKSSIEFIKNS